MSRPCPSLSPSDASDVALWLDDLARQDDDRASAARDAGDPHWARHSKRGAARRDIAKMLARAASRRDPTC